MNNEAAAIKSLFAIAIHGINKVADFVDKDIKNTDISLSEKLQKIKKND